MSDAPPDVLALFLARAGEPADEALAELVAAARPRIETVVNGAVVVLSPGDADDRKRLLEPGHRARLEDAATHAGAAGWRIDPPRGT